MKLTKVSFKIILAALAASLALLVSCTKTMEIIDEEKTNPEVKPKESTVEITLNTIASPTKAIAEGTAVPTDNGIGFYPRFFSDINSADYSSYNDVYNFQYDNSSRVWRNYKRGNFSPLYWPAGERVFMDYVACSFSNYVYSQNTEANNVLMVEPIKKNPNRMDVNYEFSYLTRPFASSMLLTTTELQEMRRQVREMREMGYITPAEIAELSDLDFDKYDEAVKLAQNEITIDDDYLASDRALEGDTAEEIQADATNTLNLAYWFFMNYAPRIYRFMQDDLLYSHDRSLRDINHGEVKAVFNHSKAWVKVIVNNQTANDLFISGIRFDDVKSGGTLIIDNSKSAFEAYWDFPEEVAATGAKIDPYTEVSLDGNSSPAIVAEPGQMDVLNAVRSAVPQQTVKGMLPDQYIIPQGCYGPALAVAKKSSGEDAPIEALNCAYLKGDQRFDLGDDDCRTMVGNLGGMMFPAQEPGMITLRYTFWKKYLKPNRKRRGDPEGINTYSLPMSQAVSLFNTFLPSDNREISLNLPRQDWKMGKVYVYVLTIAENEITINPYVTEWEYADPIFYPEGSGMRTGDDPGTFDDGGDITGSFSN